KRHRTQNAISGQGFRLSFAREGYARRLFVLIDLHRGRIVKNLVRQFRRESLRQQIVSTFDFDKARRSTAELIAKVPASASVKPVIGTCRMLPCSNRNAD